MIPQQKPRGLPPEQQPHIPSVDRAQERTKEQDAQHTSHTSEKQSFSSSRGISSEHHSSHSRNFSNDHSGTQKDSSKSESAEKPLDEKQRKQSKTMSILEGSLNSVTLGLTANFISAFAIALGSSNIIIAMISTLPNLIAAVAQLSVQKVRGYFSSRKKHIVFFAVLQACMWLPLIFVPQLQYPGEWLLLFVTLNAIFGMLIGPVWNSFMSDIVEEDGRGRFFGMRNMFTGLTAFIATIMAGLIMTALKPTPFVGFGILFGLAFLFRIMSAYFLNKMGDPPESGIGTSQPNIPEFLRNADKTPLGRFTIFLMLFNIAVYIAAPFFAVYQLSILHFDYVFFTIIACASAISSFVTMLFWGKYVDSIGSKNVLVACGFLIPLVPFFWALTTNIWLIVMIEIFSGIVWAGFSLSVSTYLFDATDRQNRTRELAEYTLLVQLAVFFGAMVGSGLLGLFDKTNPLAFRTIFIVSAILRLAVVIIFYKTLRELRIIEIPVKDRIFKKFISIRPHHGIVYEPAIESVRAAEQAGSIARKDPRNIDEDVSNYVRGVRGEHTGPRMNSRTESSIKRIEQEEDERDTGDYLRKLRK